MGTDRSGDGYQLAWCVILNFNGVVCLRAYCSAMVKGMAIIKVAELKINYRRRHENRMFQSHEIDPASSSVRRLVTPLLHRKRMSIINDFHF